MYEIFSLSMGLKSKPRNGDCADHSVLDDEGLVVVAAVADGVGEHAYDWAASQAVCTALLPAFAEGVGSSIEERMEQAVMAAHDAVQSLRGKAAGALSTLVFVVWHPASGMCRYVSIGDSRLFKVSGAEISALTEDDSRGVVLKRQGEVVLQDGAVAFCRALTKALGQTQPLDFTVSTTKLEPGEMLALATDGCYELPGFKQLTLEIQNYVDLEGAARTLFRPHCDQHGKDDATLTLLRGTQCPVDMRERCLEALEGGGCLAEARLVGYLVVPIIVEEMVRRAATSQAEFVKAGLDYLIGANLRPVRKDVMRIIEAVIDDGRPETLHEYRRLVKFAGRL